MSVFTTKVVVNQNGNKPNNAAATKPGTLRFDERHFRFEEYNVPYRSIKRAVLHSTYRLFVVTHFLTIDDGTRTFTFGPIRTYELEKKLPFTVIKQIKWNWFWDLAFVIVLVFLVLWVFFMLNGF